jgi:hypothetical protein
MYCYVCRCVAMCKDVWLCDYALLCAAMFDNVLLFFALCDIVLLCFSLCDDIQTYIQSV